MRKLIYAFLFCNMAIVFGQTKPRNPVAPSGAWADSLLRAYCFSRLDSVRIDSVDDFSSKNVWGVQATPTAAAWVAEGTESPRYSKTTAADGRHIVCGNFSTYSVTDQFSIAIRVKLVTSGSTGDAVALFDRLDTPDESFVMTDLDFDADASSFCIDNGADVCASAGDLGATNDKVTVIGTYAGDSIRVYLNGVKKAASAKTGNIITDSNYILSIGRGSNGGSFQQGAVDILMLCIWKRVISASEISAITADPYVMFKAAATTGQVNRIKNSLRWW